MKKIKVLDYEKVLKDLYGYYDLDFLKFESKEHPDDASSGIDYYRINIYSEDGKYYGQDLLRLDVLDYEVIGITIYSEEKVIFSEGYAWDDKWRLRKIG
jgi:hypothetical protein